MVVSFQSSVGPSPKSMISFFLLSVCLDGLLSTLKTTFLPSLPFGNEKSECASNQNHSHYIHISQDQHFVILTAPNKQSPNANLVFNPFQPEAHICSPFSC